MDHIYPSILPHLPEALVQHLLDAIPLCCFCEDENSLLACNDEAVRLFGLSDKQEFLDKFHVLSPSHQLCGTESRELKRHHIRIYLINIGI